ncbi:MAG: ChaN family lipoprotein [Burkholderiales bacterium]|nr:ChaN family lipoprotein [Burkholderiales bacterium]
MKKFGFVGMLAACCLVSACATHTTVSAPGGHPLVGRVWDVAAGRFVAPDTAYQRAAASRYVLLGERHDSAYHHAGQLDVLRALADRSVVPTVAMEQMDAGNQAALSAAQASGVQDPEALADAGQLNRKGWGWPMYKALLAQAGERHWPLLAANLSRAQARDIALGKVVPTVPAVDDAQRALMENDIIQGHCGQRPEPARLNGIVLAQRARDVQMAQVLDSAKGPVALIAGAGHVRTDRAVPRYLAEPQRALVIAFVEVEDGKPAPGDYDAAGLDLLWFTPTTPRPDPCAAPLTGSVAAPKPIIESKEKK